MKRKLLKKDRVSDKDRFSIVTKDMNRCFVCGKIGGLHKHEIFFGSGKRELSKYYGLVVPLCWVCHEHSKDGVHHNRELDLHLKYLGQMAFEAEYPELDFLVIFGRNYI